MLLAYNGFFLAWFMVLLTIIHMAGLLIKRAPHKKYFRPPTQRAKKKRKKDKASLGKYVFKLFLGCCSYWKGTMPLKKKLL